MLLSSLKQLAVFGILVTTFSQSLCETNALQNTSRLLETDPIDFLDRSYIKTSDGPRETKRSSFSLTTTTSPDGETRKLATGEIRCVLWQNCMLFQEELGDIHQWECTFDTTKVSGYESKLVVVNGVENTNHFLMINGAESGKSVLVMSQAEIETDKVVVDVNNVIGVEDYKSSNVFEGSVRGHTAEKPPRVDGRMLADMEGTLTTLVVRVKAIDNSPTADAAQISEDVFGDENCLKTQFASCSYNKLQIQEYIPGTVSQVPTDAPGVMNIDINVNAEGNTKEAIQAEANDALRAKLGNVDPGTIFDLVLFCMPPGMGGWLAYAYIGRWDSYYNDEWCQMMSSQMHEVGHSIGLHHSGEYEGSDSVKEYGDQSDLMGFSYKSDDTPRMCFNPAKNWQLGWYEGKYLEVNPNNLSSEPTSFVLNGIVDYQTGSSDANVVIKIGDYYIGYNRKAAFNDEVIEGADQVLVNEKLGTPESSTKSKLAAKLDVGAVYDIPLTDLLSVRVKFVEFNNPVDAIIELSILGDIPQCQGAYDQEIVVDLTTDNYFGETSWSIVDAAGVPVFSKGDYPSTGTFSTVVGGLCRGLEYYFVIDDAYGDGICCSWGNGGFVGKFGDLILFEGGEFESKLTIPFTLPLGPTTPTQPPAPSPTTKAPTQPPTPSPTPSPTKAPTPSPTKAPTEPPIEPPQCEGSSDEEIVVDITTDNYFGETSWSIVDTATGVEIFSKSGYTATGTFSSVVGGLCRGLEYSFVINDSYGDGICCGYGNGGFVGKFGDLILFEGGEFGSTETIQFTLPLVPITPSPTTQPPTNAPTPSPTPPPTNPPTNAPTNAPTPSPTPLPTDPPTNAPTNAPTNGPTNLPTNGPTNVPTNLPTNPPTNPPFGECDDDPNFLYRGREGDTCADFVAPGTDRRTRIICQRRANADTTDDRKVFEYCRATCDIAGINRAC